MTDRRVGVVPRDGDSSWLRLDELAGARERGTAVRFTAVDGRMLSFAYVRSTRSLRRRLGEVRPDLERRDRVRPALSHVRDPLVARGSHRLPTRERVRPQGVAARRELVDRRAHRGRMVDADCPIGEHVAQRLATAVDRCARAHERSGDVEDHDVGEAESLVAAAAGCPRRGRTCRLRLRADARAGARRASAVTGRLPRSASREVARRNTPCPSSTANTTSSPGASPSA